MIIRFTTNNKQNANVIFTSISSHNLTICLFSSYNYKKMRHTICEWLEFTRLFFVFRVTNGYPRVKTFTRALHASEILYPYSYPRVKFYIHSLTHQVGYPRVPAPEDKIAIPSTWSTNRYRSPLLCIPNGRFSLHTFFLDQTTNARSQKKPNLKFLISSCAL